jgi:hypothetical protein
MPKSTIHYQCTQCKWITTVKSSFQAHLNRKTDCRLDKRILNKIVNQILENEYNNKPSFIDNKRYKCDKCDKQLTTKRYLHNHYEICTGVNSLTCSVCKQTFKNRHRKSYHIKQNKCKPFDINLDSNIIKLTVNEYENENIDYLYTVNNFSNFVKLCSGLKTGNWHDLIMAIFYDKDTPQNHTIKITYKRSREGFIYKNGYYQLKLFCLIESDIFDKIHNTMDIVINTHISYYNTQKELQHIAGDYNKQFVNDYENLKVNFRNYNKQIKKTKHVKSWENETYEIYDSSSKIYGIVYKSLKNSLIIGSKFIFDKNYLT